MALGFPSDFKELVRSRTDLVELIGESVALEPERGGRGFKGLCPFHDDHNPSLTVSPERQSYKCWSCGEGGDCYSFVMKTQALEFPAAVRLLAELAGIEIPREHTGGNGQGGRRIGQGLTGPKEGFRVHVFMEDAKLIDEAVLLRCHTTFEAPRQSVEDRLHIGKGLGPG